MSLRSKVDLKQFITDFEINQSGLLIGVAILVGLLVTGATFGWWLSRGDWVYPGQSQIDPALSTPLTSETTLGQTFVAYQAGLTLIEVVIDHVELSAASTNPRLTLHLRTGPEATQDLRQVTIAADAVQAGARQRFSFEPLSDSRLTGYYFFLTLEDIAAGDQVILAQGPPDAYLDGAAYQNDSPQERQLAFYLGYDRFAMSLDFLTAILAAVPTVLIIIALLLAPGSALMAYLWPRNDLDWFGRVGVAVGLSLAGLPLILLAGRTMGLVLAAWAGWGLILISLMALGGRWWFERNRGENRAHSVEVSLTERSPENVGQILVLVCLSLIIIGGRLWIIRDLRVPLWGDSYQHTVIAQLLFEHGGLFDSWEPYSFSSTFTYHFGFHTFSLFLRWLLGTPMPQTVLLAGQILNALAVLLLYPLAYQLSQGRRWLSITVILVVGLVLSMPNFYVNWGRYTQLMGQVLLPIAALLIFNYFRRPTWPVAILAVIATAGLGLSHYRVAIMCAALALVWLAADWLMRKEGWPGLKRRVIAAIWFGLGVGLVMLPWFIRLAGGFIPKMGGRLARNTVNAQVTAPTFWQALVDVGSYFPAIWWWVALAGILLGLRRRLSGAVVVALWLLIWVVLGEPNLFHLPGVGLVSKFAIQIALYMPLGLAIGLLADELIRQLPRSNLRLWLVSGLMLILAVLLIPAQLKVVDRTRFALVTPADEQAAQWIQQNLPAQSLFLVDGFPAYDEALVAGSDGGWWLPLLAGRQTSLPPLAYSFERAPAMDRWDWVKEMVSVSQTQDLASDEAVDYLQAAGISHIYFGQRRGRVGNPYPPNFSPEMLLANPRYQLVYQQDRVRIFAIGSEVP